MDPFRIALANIRFPATPEESITLAGPGHRRGLNQGSTDHLLPGMLRPRLSRNGQIRAAARSRVPRARLVRHRRGSREGQHHRHSRDRTCGRRRTRRNRPGHQSGRIDRGFSGQGPDRPVGGGHLHTRLWPPRLSSRRLDVRRRDLPRRLAISRDRPLGRATRSTGRVSPALPRSGTRFVTGRRPSPIPRTRFTRRRRSAEPPRTPAISQPSISRVPAHRPRRRSSAPMGPCSATSPTVRKDC